MTSPVLSVPEERSSGKFLFVVLLLDSMSLSVTRGTVHCGWENPGEPAAGAAARMFFFILSTRPICRAALLHFRAGICFLVSSGREFQDMFSQPHRTYGSRAVPAYRVRDILLGNSSIIRFALDRDIVRGRGVGFKVSISRQNHSEKVSIWRLSIFTKDPL